MCGPISKFFSMLKMAFLPLAKDLVLPIKNYANETNVYYLKNNQKVTFCLVKPDTTKLTKQSVKVSHEEKNNLFR